MAEKVNTSTKPLAQVISDHIGENVYLCYQCLKCTSGCPLIEHMDLHPNQVMRAAQLDDVSVLESKTIWACASCQTCTTRCPQGIDIAAVMDYVSRLRPPPQKVEAPDWTNPDFPGFVRPQITNLGSETEGL